MVFRLSKFTIRIDSVCLQKFKYVAKYHTRSSNREIVLIMKKHIDKFEHEHGKITDE